MHSQSSQQLGQSRQTSQVHWRHPQAWAWATGWEEEAIPVRAITVRAIKVFMVFTFFLGLKNRATNQGGPDFNPGFINRPAVAVGEARLLESRNPNRCLERRRHSPERARRNWRRRGFRAGKQRPNGRKDNRGTRNHRPGREFPETRSLRPDNNGLLTGSPPWQPNMRGIPFGQERRTRHSRESQSSATTKVPS